MSRKNLVEHMMTAMEDYAANLEKKVAIRNKEIQKERERSEEGFRGLPRRPLRGHEPVRDPRQARHHHAQGHPARPPHPRRALLNCSWTDDDAACA